MVRVLAVVLALVVAPSAAFTPVASRWARQSVVRFGDYESGETVDRTTELAPSLDEECDLSNEERCKQYQERVKELQTLMSEAQDVNDKIEARITSIQNLKLDDVPEVPAEDPTSAVAMGNLDDECVLSTSAKCVEYRKALAQLQQEIAKAN
eukprot:CAMPEP_0182522302 /NCGR_PEP_ID=MMETSP1323-20130603/197_1 /TAXON_ID=236787 /ORGANISM="Florenciella parvula, Strain RCC1693" /LENGTH=151 /DNA_ID=CAMNT_0024730403 /DNA_START=36 /DNA_END=491 /DNA_ORIENTATION=+